MCSIIRKCGFNAVRFNSDNIESKIVPIYEYLKYVLPTYLLVKLIHIMIN